MARFVALVLCAATKIRHLPVAQVVGRMDAVREFHSKTRPEFLVGGWLSDGQRDLSDQPAGALGPGRKRTLCLATNLPDRELTLRAYRRRMWCEEFHGDIKKHGFNLESTMLQSFEKLSRLTLAVAFLYIWLISAGGRTIHQGLRHLVDRHDRRDLSIFQIGLRFTERMLTNDLFVEIPLFSYL